MQITCDNNQLSFAPQADSRIIDLRVWMLRNGITFPMLGKLLGGITGSAVQQLLARDCISLSRHKEFLALGVPGHLLPPARDIPRGRRPKA
jgi:hypothetical protein